MAKLTDYELQRQRNIEENKRAMQDFGILEAASDLATSNRKPQAPRRRSSLGGQSPEGVLDIRRSGRVQNMPAVSYKDLEERNDFLRLPRGGGRRAGGPYKSRSTSWTCPLNARIAAREQAEAIQVEGPSFVKPLLPSMTAGGFWLQWPVDWCLEHMPPHDVWVTLLDDDGVSWESKYLGGKKGLSAGWRGYSIEKGFGDGDAIIVELLDKEKWRMKVHIVRAERDDSAEPAEEVEAEELQIEDEEEEVVPVSADSEPGAAALARDPSIDSPPRKRKRAAKLSTFYEEVKVKPAGKKAKSKVAVPKSLDNDKLGLKKRRVELVSQRRVSPAGIVSFLVKVEGVEKPLWVENGRVSGDSTCCWLSGDEEEGEL